MISTKKINELVAKNRKLINNKNLFTSNTMVRYIQELADLSIKKEIERYDRIHEKPYSRRTKVKVRLDYNVKNSKVAYAATSTNERTNEDIITIFINIGHQMFSKVKERERLLLMMKVFLLMKFLISLILITESSWHLDKEQKWVDFILKLMKQVDQLILFLD